MVKAPYRLRHDVLSRTFRRAAGRHGHMGKKPRRWSCFPAAVETCTNDGRCGAGSTCRDRDACQGEVARRTRLEGTLKVHEFGQGRGERRDTEGCPAFDAGGLSARARL